MKTAELVHDRTALEREIVRMGKQIDAQLGSEIALFLPVMHGALIFSAALALAISHDLEFDYVHATRYRGSTQGSQLHWINQPQTSMQDRTVILVDDILDEGHTLSAIRDYCLEQGARQVLIAVLCVKRHDRTIAGIAADFVGVEVPDRYVFGFGMDYHEHGRNLPGIYALHE
ncbi:MAG TPA: hypoxanthine-guanine phosphoribosyltransferase [Rudaea sp.]|nr:hypoxanthine-guanine phosphoribosyltransferase [Rudaea sp.]